MAMKGQVAQSLCAGFRLKLNRVAGQLAAGSDDRSFVKRIYPVAAIGVSERKSCCLAKPGWQGSLKLCTPSLRGVDKQRNLFGAKQGVSSL
jgi:hypothetical protein